MSQQNIFDIKYHFSLLNDIVLFGKVNDLKFICFIKKNIKKINNTDYEQNEGCIYIKDNNGLYYCVQVILFPQNKSFLNKPSYEIFIKLINQFNKEIYENLKNNSSQIIIKENNYKFEYFLYDIPAYIWCVTVGMITTKL